MDARMDFSVLEQLRKMGGEEIVQTVVQIFLKNSPVILDSIAESLGRGEDIQVSRLAHKLKSSSGNVGAIRLFELLDHFEFVGDENRMKEREALFPSVRAEFEEVKSELNRSLDSVGKLAVNPLA